MISHSKRSLSFFTRFYTSKPEQTVLERWLKGWHASHPASPLFEGDDSPTALSWLRRRCPQVPEAALHRLFRSEKIRMWDPATDQVKRIKKDTLLPVGARVLLPKSSIEIGERTTDTGTAASQFSAQQQRQLEKLAEQLRHAVLLDTEEYLAINKPAGIPVQGGSGITLSIDRLLPYAFPELTEDEDRQPKLVHRLDREATGVLFLGKGANATARLAEAFRGKSLSAVDSTRSTSGTIRADVEVKKVYWAVVVRQSSLDLQNGQESTRQLLKGARGIIETPLAHRRGLEPALTRYKVLERNQRLAWLELEPITGRKHQLRKHCSLEFGGAAILGDQKYGTVRLEPQRSVLESVLSDTKRSIPLFLHCRMIKVKFPGQRGWLQAEAPLPNYWKPLLKLQGWRPH